MCKVLLFSSRATLKRINLDQLNFTLNNMSLFIESSVRNLISLVIDSSCRHRDHIQRAIVGGFCPHRHEF